MPSNVHSRTQQENTALAIPLQYHLLTDLSVLLMKSAEQPSFMLTNQAESMRILDLGLAERREKTQEISGGKEWWMCLDCENGATHMHIKLPQANI